MSAFPSLSPLLRTELPLFWVKIELTGRHIIKWLEPRTSERNRDLQNIGEDPRSGLMLLMSGYFA